MKTLEVLEKVLKGKRLAVNTQRHYSEALRELAEYSEEWPKRGLVINEWLASLEGFSDTTVRMRYAYVNSAGKYMKQAYRLKNPCETAERPKVSKKRRRYFTTDELVMIINACRSDEDRALVLTLIDSTCRIGELEGLKGGQIGDMWIDVKGKTGQRRYRLDSSLCSKLRELAGGDDKYVFKGRYGNFESVQVLKNRVTRIVKRAGITGSKLGPHTLRHSSGSLVAQETGSALAVKALLQHDNIDTSMEYIHDAEEVLQQRISPLRLLGEKVMAKGEPEVKQLKMGNEGEIVEVETEVVEDFLEEEIREVKDGVEVRSLLKTDDLRLLRRAFIGYIRACDDGADKPLLKALMRRMLRKVK